MKKTSPEAVVQVPRPGTGAGALKLLGGSDSDDFNNILSTQVLSSLWLDSDPETRNRQIQAALAALMGIRPSDEIEGMLAAQMVATHNAAMTLLGRLRSAELVPQQDSA